MKDEGELSYAAKFKGNAEDEEEEEALPLRVRQKRPTRVVKDEEIEETLKSPESF